MVDVISDKKTRKNRNPNFSANLTGKGRPPGVPNKTTKLVKEAIADAFEQLGGMAGLVKWAKADDKNLTVFYSALLPKLIPVQTELTGKDGGAIQMEQKTQDDAAAVASRILSLAERSRAARVVDGAIH